MYLEQAYKGLSEGWRYLVGIIIVFFGWQIVGAIPLVTTLIIKTGSLSILLTANEDMGILSRALGSNLFLFYMLVMFAIGLLFLFLFVKFAHEQTITSLTTSRKKIDWSRVLFAFVLWAVITVLFIFLEMYLSPEDYEYNFNLGPFLILAVVAILLIPIQISMEEYFIRGYMMQGLGVAGTKRWLTLVVTSC